MRIAYVAPYQGASLLNRRPTVLNRSLSRTLKIELLARLLRSRHHDVEIISQGEVVENKLAFYRSFSEAEPFYPQTPVHYASALPIRRINGYWSNHQTLQLLKARHRVAPFDLVMIWNLKGPQLTCADYTIRELGVPVVLEYEDDHFVDRSGNPLVGFRAMRNLHAYRRLFERVSGCVAVSPHLLSQLPDVIPKMLLRGVIGEDLIAASRVGTPRKNHIVFSGTHVTSNGVVELMHGWNLARIPNWELHITGYGELTDEVRRLAQGIPGVCFHGLIERDKLVRLMTEAAICINPHVPSRTPGNLFAFKLVEYLAAGAHVVTTPMGQLERSLEAGLTYLSDNAPATISATLQRVIAAREYERTAAPVAHDVYGPATVSAAIDTLVRAAASQRERTH